MSQPTTTFGNLQSDIKAEILCSLDDFDTLYATITSSTDYSRIFKTYRTSILKQVAKNVLKDSWGEAVTVAIYQRHCDAEGKLMDIMALKTDLGSAEPILGDIDIRNLAANHGFFSSLNADVITANQYSENSDKSQLVLQPKFFYQMWVFALQYGYEGLEAFKGRKHLTFYQLWQLCDLSRTMVDNPAFGKFIHSPHWDLGGQAVGLSTEPTDLFSLSSKVDLIKFAPATLRKNPILRQKTIFHSTVMNQVMDLDPTFREGLGPLLQLFITEYPSMGTNQINQIYGNLRDWN